MLDIVPWFFLTVAVAISRASVVDMELTSFKFSLKRFLTCSAYSMLSIFFQAKSIKIKVFSLFDRRSFLFCF